MTISPGKETEFSYFQQSLAVSAALDRVIEATEADWVGTLSIRDSATDNVLSRLIGSLSSKDLTGAGQYRAEAVPGSGHRRSTMWVDVYVAEKLSQLDDQRLARIPLDELRKLESWRPSAAGRVAAAVGRSMRRAGEALELWATPASERDMLRISLARARRPE